MDEVWWGKEGSARATLVLCPMLFALLVVLTTVVGSTHAAFVDGSNKLDAYNRAWFLDGHNRLREQLTQAKSGSTTTNKLNFACATNMACLTW